MIARRQPRVSVDLHLHTTASDGACAPDELIRRARAIGLRGLSITDHDTMAAVEAARAAAAPHGLDVVPGIEITAVWQGRDVHVLGYYLDPGSRGLDTFLEHQRADRVRRLRDMVARLAELNVPVVLDALSQPVPPGHALGRPHVADALIAAGHVRSRNEAFDVWIGEGRPAYVPRRGPSPAEVIALIAGAGGISSLAHPGLLHDDALVERLADSGLDALEVYHPEHDPEAVERYAALATRSGLAATGGSDYHGDAPDGVRALGCTGLTWPEFERLRELAHAGGTGGSRRTAG